MLQHQYNYSKFINCREIAEFAKIYNFKDENGELLGRNKVFKILRELKILNKKNVPYQSYAKNFKTLEKEYQQGDKIFKKVIIFVKPSGQSYLANKINDYLDKKSESKSATVVDINTKQVQKSEKLNKNNQNSYFEFTKEEAFNFCKNLPIFLRERSQIYKDLVRKWNFDEG